MQVGIYNFWLVCVSVGVAVVACYTALEMAGRIAASEGRSRTWWFAGGSVAMGVGIWSTHFTGMLALSLPNPMGYDPGVTFVSLLIAIAVCALALRLVCYESLTPARLAGGAAVVGLGLTAMHFTGMDALRMSPPVHYVAWAVELTAMLAIATAAAGLTFARRLCDHPTEWGLPMRAGAALVLGLATAACHYVGMAAERFVPGSLSAAAAAGITPCWLAVPITVATLAVLSISLVASVLDARMKARVAALASSLADAKHELSFLGLHDKLTNLPNRVLLEDRLNQAIRAAQRDHRQLAVLFVDLDGFKAVNDSYGHNIGDLVLIEAAERLRLNVRASDTVARLGGDQFVLLASGLGEAPDASRLAGKLLSAIGRPFQIDADELLISASIGIAFLSGEQTCQELVKNASAAVDHAKSLGRNGYCFFDNAMNVNAHEQLHLLRDLRLALERNELQLYYQAKQDALTRRVVGAEALLRWNHPVRGLTAPETFIALAEDSGLILTIGEWVLDEACRQRSAWSPFVDEGWSIAVNLSPLQFGHPGLVHMVGSALRRHHLPPQALTLEITETTAMRDANASMNILQNLSAMGVRISIDDFGTGYSSLLYLKRLPATEIKIDGGFIRDLTHGGEDAAIVSLIVALGKMLKRKIVAEGIETEAQREFLTQLGCDALQGFLLGRPMPPDQFMEREPLVPGLALGLSRAPGRN